MPSAGAGENEFEQLTHAAAQASAEKTARRPFGAAHSGPGLGEYETDR
jgi:hypothetical protein